MRTPSSVMADMWYNPNKLKVCDGTCHKITAVLCDVHGIDGAGLGALQFSNDRAVIHVPVRNLRINKNHSEHRRSHSVYTSFTNTIYGKHIMFIVLCCLMIVHTNSCPVKMIFNL